MSLHPGMKFRFKKKNRHITYVIIDVNGLHTKIRPLRSQRTRLIYTITLNEKNVIFLS